MAKSWKENLLKSSLPLEYETACILAANDILVNGEYSYVRPNENNIDTDFSIDIHAEDYFYLGKEEVWAELQYIIECKYCHENVNWVFYPAIDTIEGHGFLDPYDFLTPYVLESEYLENFDSNMEYAIKGLELLPESANPNTIIRGLEQLRHATANVIFQSIKKTFEHPFSAEYPIQIFAPILVTTAKLRILNDDIKIEEIKKATEIEDISKTVESLLIIPPHNLSFDKYFSDLKSKYLTPYEKAMRNLYTALGKVKETDIIAQSIYPSMANFKLPNACQRILVVNLESLDKNLKTIHRRIQSAKKDLKTFGKVESVFFSEEYKIKPEL